MAVGISAGRANNGPTELVVVVDRQIGRHGYSVGASSHGVPYDERRQLSIIEKQHAAMTAVEDAPRLPALEDAGGRAIGTGQSEACGRREAVVVVDAKEGRDAIVALPEVAKEIGMVDEAAP
jgi:hypothetical protein